MHNDDKCSSFSLPEWLVKRKKMVRQLERHYHKLNNLENKKDTLSKYGYEMIGYYSGLTTATEDIITEIDISFGLPIQVKIHQIEEK